MSRSTNVIKLLAKAGIEASRSSEAVSVLPSTIHCITDPNHDLYCPGVDDSPSTSLVQSMRNGWMEGSTIVCVNLGTKDEPLPHIVAGRSRKKSADIVNDERAKDGLDPIKVDIVFCSLEDAYAIMLLENNRQERGPLFDARRWQQHKRVVARRLGKATLSDAEKVEARREFAELISCHESTIAGWEKMLENPPEVLAMIEAGKISPTDAKELAKHVPEANRAEKAVEIANRNSETNKKASKGTTKKAHREAVLGKSRTFSQKEIGAIVVGADKLSTDEEMLRKFYDENGHIDVKPLLRASEAEGFALFGKLMTGKIKVDDLPEHIAAIVEEVLNKK
jgi:ParB-like chromosome segregation protein Spo0J